MSESEKKTHFNESLNGLHHFVEQLAEKVKRVEDHIGSVHAKVNGSHFGYGGYWHMTQQLASMHGKLEAMERTMTKLTGSAAPTTRCVEVPKYIDVPQIVEVPQGVGQARRQQQQSTQCAAQSDCSQVDVADETEYHVLCSKVGSSNPKSIDQSAKQIFEDLCL